MRVLMTGGGTAGHVNPAIAIANTIKEYESDAIIEFVSSNLKNDKARELVSRASYKLHGVDICGRYQIWNPKNIKTAYYMVKSNIQAKKIIKEFAPDVIIGTGGFACYPLLKAGADMGIPTLLHESNAIPGRAVKRLSDKVDCIMTNFDAAIKALPNAKCAVRVGNPTLISKKRAEHNTVNENVNQVLSFGGSGGAEEFNNGMYKLLSELCDVYPDTKFIHASGKRDYDRMKSMFSEAGLDKKQNIILKDYIYNMDEEMGKSDIIISRAGAMTISELALMGKAAIFVPFPYAAANHQYGNAKAIADKDGCELVTEDSFASDSLTAAIEKLLSDADLRKKYSQNIKSFATDKANDNVYAEILKLLGK